MQNLHHITVIEILNICFQYYPREVLKSENNEPNRYNNTVECSSLDRGKVNLVCKYWFVSTGLLSIIKVLVFCLVAHNTAISCVQQQQQQQQQHNTHAGCNSSKTSCCYYLMVLTVRHTLRVIVFHDRICWERFQMDAHWILKMFTCAQECKWVIGWASRPNLTFDGCPPTWREPPQCMSTCMIISWRHNTIKQTGVSQTYIVGDTDGIFMIAKLISSQ